MKYYLVSIFLVIITFGHQSLSAQKMKVTEFRSDLRDISARENAIYDVNGDACSILKIRTGLPDLKFLCDLGIQKTEHFDGEYWLWVSPNTQSVTIETEQLDKLEYVLPVPTDANKVYVISIDAILPDKVVFRNINSIKVGSSPKRSEIYFNDVYMGRTPATMNISSDTFKYEIRKKRYISSSGNFIYGENQNDLFVSLKKDPAVNRFYFISYVSGGNKYATPVFGFESGVIGKTGMYFSFVPPIRGEKYIAVIKEYEYSYELGINTNTFYSLVGDSPDNYYLKLREADNSFYTNFRIRLGVTKLLWNDSFLKFGIGIATATNWYKMNVIPYSNDPSLEIPLPETFYGKGDSPVNGLSLEAGMIFRIYKKVLLNFSISSTGFSRFITSKPIDIYLPLEGSLGIGYRFK